MLDPILEEDPQHAVEIPDNDEDDEATGNGLGHEDGDPDDEDELDDEGDEGPDVDDDKGMATKAQRYRHPLPSWLLEPFKARVAESSTQYRNAAGLLPLYAIHQTFWFPQPSTFFLVTTNSTPQQIFNPLFFLWDPEALCPNGIPCPNCQNVLHRHQAISRPRRCVGIDQTFWIIGYQYHCRHCVHPKSNKSTVTFRSWDRMDWVGEFETGCRSSVGEEGCVVVGWAEGDLGVLPLFLAWKVVGRRVWDRLKG